MTDISPDEWPDCLPELGQFIRDNSSEIMQAWEEVLRKRLADNPRTTHRVALRDHLPQFLKSLARDLITGRDGRDAESRPAAKEHGLQRWRQGYEIELVIRDYQLIFQAILNEVHKGFGRPLETLEVANLNKLLNEASVVAIRTFLAFQPENGVATPDEDVSESVLDNCIDAVIVCSPEGTVLKWNKGARSHYEYSAEDMVGKNVSSLVPPQHRLVYERSLAALQSGKEVGPIDTVRQRADGSEISVSVAASPLCNRHGEVTGFVAIERNISDRVRAAEALREALEEAERANRTKSEFLANVSHELRTPMNAILGMTELALDEDLSPELRDYLETSQESAEMLLVLVNDVLDISRLEAGKFALDESSFSLREVLDDTIRSVSSRAFRKGLEIACRISTQAPDALQGDPLRLRQIITNLVGNAIKFTEEGEVVVEVNLDSKSGQSCVLRFSVSDTGIGISEEDQHRIFTPFTQADSSSTRRFTGTGLGLAIAGHLVNCFRGQFWVQSELGVGSIFYFTSRFPLADGEDEKHGKERQHIQTLRDLPILVADDNETNLDIIGNMLTDWQMKPVLACDAPSALEQLKSAQKKGQPIPLVVVDALMPENDGFELAETIKAADDVRTKTVLMISSADRLAFKERVEELQVDGILEKPVSESNLFDAIVSTMGIGTVDKEGTEFTIEQAVSSRCLDVLLVEDTPANRKVVEKILSKRGHLVITANNGREALDLFRERQFDLILMDVQMPSMDGIQATEAIRTVEAEREAEQGVPIIAMTAHAMAGDRGRCLAAGMDGYVSKPISMRKLIRIVEKYARRDSSQPAVAGSPNSEMPATKQSKSIAANFPNTGELNLQNVIKRLGGDIELLRDLIGFYLEDYPGLLERIEEALIDEDAGFVQRAAHSMKGLVANFDARTCRDTAAQIELIAKQRQLETVPDLLAQLRKCTAKLARELESYREQMPPNRPSI